jgi:ferredoxin-NADP reductase
MSSLALLLWIAAAILLQVAVYLAAGFWRHWLDYRALLHRSDEFKLPVTEDVPTEALVPNVALWPGLRPFRVERKNFEDAAQSVCSFYLVPEDGQALPPFKPGQFLTFSLDLPAQGGHQPLVRCYSLSDAPGPDYYRISVKRIPAPPGGGLPPGRSSGFLHDQIDVGAILQVRAPGGHFYIDRSESPVALVGGGIGITPMLSMLNWCLAEQPEREIWLFYGVRNGRELVMKSHLEGLAAKHPNFRLRFCFSDPLPEDISGERHQIRGRVDVGLLRMELPLKPYHYYICGPSPMMESLVPALAEWGVPDGHIHFEAFGPASIKRKPAATEDPVIRGASRASEITVTFAQSGKQFSWQPGVGSLLEFAETNGVAVNSGCRAGGCGTCQTTIKTGEVIYHQTPDYDPDAGTCLLCVCTPKTSVTLEA